MSTTERPKIRGSRGCELLRYVEPVDPRAAEGYRRQAGSGSVPLTAKEMEKLVEEEKARSMTNPYQKLLYEVKALQKRGNFKTSQGDTIVQRIRDLSLPDYSTLDLSNFTIFDEFAGYLAPYMQSSMCKLKHVNLAGTQIGINGALLIARSVNPVLETLQFSETALDLALFRKSSSSSRQQIVLGRHAFGPLDAVTVGILLERVRTRLDLVDLSGNQLTGLRSSVYTGTGVIFKALTRCPLLSSLNLQSVSLRSDGLVDLANAIKDLPALEVLVLSDNKLALNSGDDKRSTGIEALCSALWQASALRDLCLADNCLDYSSAASIADMMAANTRLERLDLSSNPLANAGAVHIAAGMKKNSSLTDLQMTGCRFGDEAIQALSAALKRSNRTLRKLDIRDNSDIRSSGYRSLVKCLTTNPSLCELGVDQTAKSARYSKNIDSLIEVNAAIRELQLGKSSPAFANLSSDQCTNLLQKVSAFSDADLVRFNADQLVGNVPAPAGQAISNLPSLKQYAHTEQQTPLKRLLWVLEARVRRDQVDQRDQRANKKHATYSQRAGDSDPDDVDDDDVWDYPLY